MKRLPVGLAQVSISYLSSINDVFWDFCRLAALLNLVFLSRIISNLERNLIFLILMLLQRYSMNNLTLKALFIQSMAIYSVNLRCRLMTYNILATGKGETIHCQRDSLGIYLFGTLIIIFYQSTLIIL